MHNIPTAVQGQQQGAPQFASLYVGDLDPEVTEAMLYEIFNTVGPVASIRVCRDSITRRSLGYAYVNFHNANDAERVMDTLNYSTIKGRCCRIMWSHRDPNLRKTGSGNVFVKNLDKNVDNKALYDTFSLFGNILSCKVASDEDGKSRGYGFVHYETSEAAKQAIEKVNGMQIGEKQVYVGEFIPRDSRAPAEITNYTNLYCKNFPMDWDEEKVNEVFNQFGEVTSSMYQKDNLGRPSCFINYAVAEEAKLAVDTMHEKDLRTPEEIEANPHPEEEVNDKVVPADNHPSHLCYCQRAQTKNERNLLLKDQFGKLTPTLQQGINLYVKNIDDTITEDELRVLFAAYGAITSCVIMKDERSRSKGFGFVCFQTSDEATKAVTDMHLKVVKSKPLYVGLAEKKCDRVARLQAQYKGEGKGGLVTFDQTKGGKPGQKGGFNVKGQNMMQQQMFDNSMMQQRPNPMMQGFPQQRNPMMQGYPMMQGVMGKGGPQQLMGGPNMMQKGNMMNMMGGPPQMAKGGKGFPQSQQKVAPGGLGQQGSNGPKQLLGERLYPAVARLQPDLAGKITGMMLEMETSEILQSLESEAQLRLKVDEAMKVLSSM